MKRNLKIWTRLFQLTHIIWSETKTLILLNFTRMRTKVRIWMRRNQTVKKKESNCKKRMIMKNQTVFIYSRIAITLIIKNMITFSKIRITKEASNKMNNLKKSITKNMKKINSMMNIKTKMRQESNQALNRVLSMKTFKKTMNQMRCSSIISIKNETLTKNNYHQIICKNKKNKSLLKATLIRI